MKRILTSALLCFTVVFTQAQPSEIFAPGGKAINGYDAVAFFLDSKAVPGLDSINYQWQGATWFFVNNMNRSLFMTDPEKYAPQFGGYCAYGVSQGHKAPTEPDTWTIVNGKLYFNYNQGVKKQWNKDQSALIEKAEKEWPSLVENSRKL